MASLTKSQQLVYDYLCSTMAERAVPPSVREICAATGLRSTSTVHSHLKSLEALGYITRDAGLNRSIHIVGASAAKQVPILGKVTAGLPILAVEDIEGYIPYPDKSGKELFALHVDGEHDQRRHSGRRLCHRRENARGGKRRDRGRHDRREATVKTLL